jgi:hypothetical protein
MILLAAGQPVIGAEQYTVSVGGEYALDALVPCDLGGAKEVAAFPAFMIAGLEAPDAPIVSPRVIRDWEFRNRFSQPQLVGIMRHAMAGDDIAALVWLKLSTASDGIDLDDPDNVAGVFYVASTYPELAVDPAVVLA